MPAHSQYARPRSRGGFTLVEMLVVIIIIGILMAIVVAGLGSAMTTARNHAMKVEMDQIGMALKEYKNQNGGYPPCFAAYQASAPSVPYPAPVMRHLGGSFRRYLRDSDGDGDHDFDDFRFDVGNATTQLAGSIPASSFSGPCDVNYLDPAEALVFWLGGLPVRRVGTTGDLVFELTGFSADQANPFVAMQDTTGAVFASSTPQQAQRTKKLFDFDGVRLADRDNDGWPEYIPKAPTPRTGLMPPFVYFDAVTYNASTAASPVPFYQYPTTARAYYGTGTLVPAEWGICWPWLRLGPPVVQWMQADDFQLICAGLDGTFNAGPSVSPLPKVFPTGLEANTNYDQEYDNLSNFAEGVWEDSQK